MKQYKTVTEALLGNDTEKRGIRFFVNSKEEIYCSYHELLEEAKEYLARFQSCGMKKGDEVILQFNSQYSLVLTLWACFLGGMIPVPLSYADNNEKKMKIFNIFRILKNPWIATDSSNYKNLLKNYSMDAGRQEEFFKIETKVVLPDELPCTDIPCVIPEINSDDITFLQFSSGSTGIPKGIVMTHRKILASVYSYARAYSMNQDDIFLSWMPLSHDFGIFGYHIAPVILGIEQNLMPTNLFMVEPMFWMRTVNKYRATILGSPSFGIRQFNNQFEKTIAEEEQWDLSCVKAILNAGELISKSVLDHFTKIMSKYGLNELAMSPCYGLSESILLVAASNEKDKYKSCVIDRTKLNIGDNVGHVSTDSPTALEIVSCGALTDIFSVRISDENHTALPEDVIGVIEIFSECILSEYYRNEDATKNAFSEDGYFNTFDLGFMHQGELYIVGRVKEMIIINGVNYFPHDIESVIYRELCKGDNEENPFIAGACYNEKKGTEELIIYVHYQGEIDDFLPMINKVKQVVMDRVALEVKCVVPIKEIPKTGSGKLQRFPLAKQFESGEFSKVLQEIEDLLHKGITENFEKNDQKNQKSRSNRCDKRKVIEIVKEEVSNILNIELCDVDTGFMDMGFSSMKILLLHENLEKRLAIKLTNTAILDYSTIRRLTDYICDKFDSLQIDNQDMEKTLNTTEHLDKDIAVVGMACRFPGGAKDLQLYWDLLLSQMNPIKEVDRERWKQDPSLSGISKKIVGGFLDDVDMFDASFFRIAPKEAECIDPQHRLLLELTWEAIEDAGWNKSSIVNTNTGVYVGIFRNDYMNVGNDLGHYGEPYSYTGAALHSASGRISYTFDLKGPSVSIDTACSSSLVAIHEAMLHLRNGDCDNAIVGGANIIMDSQEHQIFSALNALSPNGRCASYDESADGYICSEGGAVLILKRLKDAIRDNDQIWGVLKGSAVNHNGAGAGFTVPSGVAQQRLINAALKDARLEVDDIDYIEGHGSGTKIGDPQEVNALSELFEHKKDTLYLGSVKSNIGHTEAAAGLAGVVKVLLSMHHGIFAPNLHFTKGNSLIDWKNNNIIVVNTPLEWKDRDGYRRAGITACGLSGTNAHVIVENCLENGESNIETSRDVYPVTISASSEKSLREYINNLVHWLTDKDDKDISVAQICHKLNLCHSKLGRRVGFVAKGNDISQFTQRLEKMVNSTNEIGRDVGRKVGPIAFIYTGQGSQYINMGKQLYEQAKVFRDTLQEVSTKFEKLIQKSLINLLFGCENIEINRALYAQPIIFAVQVSLTEYLKSLGVHPDFLIGHSIGEYAAAYVDGVMSLDDAVKMVTIRAQITEKSTIKGKMINIFVGEDKAIEMIRDYKDVFCAAINSTENVTLSGSCTSIDAIIKEAQKQRIFVEELAVQQPFHTELMSEEIKELKEKYAGFEFNKPSSSFISSVEGRFLSEEEMVDAEYWAKHMSHTVFFKQAIESAYKAGTRQFIEVGGVATLCGFVSQIYDDPDVLVLPSLRQKRSNYEQISDTLCRLWLAGVNVSWDDFYETSLRRIENFPHTVYDKKKLWYSDERNHTITNRNMTIDNNIHKNVRILEENAYMNEQGAMMKENERNVEEKELIAVRNNVAEEIHKSINRVMGAEVSAESDIFELGFDSLMVIQLRKLLKDKFKLEISTNLIFNELHTVVDIAEYILMNMPKEEKKIVSQIDDIHQEEIITPSINQSYIPEMPKCGNGGLEDLFQAQLAIMNEQIQLLKKNINLGSNSVTAINQKKILNNSEIKQTLPQNDKSMVVETEEEYPLNKEQEQFISDFVNRRVEATKKSKEYAKTYKNVLSDWIVGVNFDKRIKEIVYPVVSSKSQGANFWDIDGNKYLDTCMGYGASFFGNRSELLINAIKEQLDIGYELGPQTILAGEVAELIRELTKVERVAFTNTGTEAVMSAIRVARAVTGRNKIVRFTNSYHGTFDAILVEGEGSDIRPMSLGTPESLIHDSVVLSYGTKESLSYIRSMANEIAAVLVEPVQSRNPGLQPREYLHELRDICTQNDIALVFDEMVTGFRLCVGGAQEFYGVTADIVTYGKLIGGGMPIGIVAGKAKYIDVIDGGRWNYGDDSTQDVETVTFAGTYCKHPLSLAATRAALRYMKENGAHSIQRVNRVTERFVQKANNYFKEARVPLFIPHCCSIYRYQPTVSTNMMLLPFEMKLFFQLLLEAGVYVWERRTCYFTLVHTDEDADRILEAIKYSVETLRKGGFPFLSAIKSKDPTDKENKQKNSLSAEERGVYVISNLEGGNEAYQICMKYRVEGSISFEELKKCFEVVTEKHEMLRCKYRFDDRTIVHDFIEDMKQDCLYVDYQVEGKKAFEDFWNRAIDLKDAPLWRWALVRDEIGNTYLYLKMHHIMADGISISELIHDLKNVYEGHQMSDSTQNYQEYIKKQEEYLGSGQFEEDAQWWKEQFASVPMPLNLPTDVIRPERNKFVGTMTHFEIKGNVLQKLREYTKKNKSTMFMTLLSLWTAFLGKITKQSDFCVGFPMDGRNIGEFEHTIGMFAQTKVLRALPQGDIKFSEYLHQTKERCYEIFEHSNYPIEYLVDNLDIEKDMSRNPLFDVLFNYDVDKEVEIGFGEAKIIPELLETHTSQFDLFLDINDRQDYLMCKITYALPMYSEKQVEEWMKMFCYYIEKVVDGPDKVLNEYTILDEDEITKILKWGTGIEIPLELTSVADLIKKVISENLDQPGIYFKGKEYSFKEIDNQASYIAGKLIKAGALPGDSVCILLDRTPKLLITLLAIMKVGCNWIPLDVNYPIARIEYMLEHSKAKFLVTEEELEGGFRETEISVVTIDSDEEVVIKQDFYQYKPNDLAYTIYTSGSTGVPKGVQLEHEALINFVLGMSKELDWPNKARTACFTTPCFDIFLLETLLCWGNGGCVVLASSEETKDPSIMCDLILEGRVDCLQLTPSRLQILYSAKEKVENVLSAIQMLIIGGEAFPENLLAKLLRHKQLRLYNVYGPSETCIWSTCKRLQTSEPVTIGTPIANTYVYILDKDMKLLPEGEIGDLWIGGLGVARGYVANEEKTKEVFVKDPYLSRRMYKTGDLAKWVDGELVFKGRNDTQVKIRGYRVELGEIEQVLLSHPKVSSAAVNIQVLENNNPVLVSYYEVEGKEKINPQEIKEWVAKSLPKYMVSDFFIQLDKMPYTANGKVDRNSLKNYLLQQTPESTAIESQADDIEEKIITVWKKILGDIEINRNSKFFDVGGNSFSIVLLKEELEKYFSSTISVSDLFSYPTIALQKDFILKSEKRKESQKYCIVPFENWFGNDSEELHHQIKLEDEVYNGLNLMGQEYEIDVKEVLVIIYTIFLHKLFNIAEIPVWILDNSKVKPICVNYSDDKEINTVIENVKKEISLQESKEISDYIDIFNTYQTENSIRVGFVKQYITTEYLIPEGIDMVLGVGKSESGYTISLVTNEKLATSKMKVHLEQLKDFLNYFK